jgi:hypothetical protein
VLVPDGGQIRGSFLQHVDHLYSVAVILETYLVWSYLQCDIVVKKRLLSVIVSKLKALKTGACAVPLSDRVRMALSRSPIMTATVPIRAVPSSAAPVRVEVASVIDLRAAIQVMIDTLGKATMDITSRIARLSFPPKP